MSIDLILIVFPLFFLSFSALCVISTMELMKNYKDCKSDDRAWYVTGNINRWSIHITYLFLTNLPFILPFLLLRGHYKLVGGSTMVHRFSRPIQCFEVPLNSKLLNVYSSFNTNYLRSLISPIMSTVCLPCTFPN